MVSASDERFMRKAIEVAKKGIEAGQTPFGSCIVKGGRVVAACHNTVWGTCDPTAHSEVNTVREACRKLKNIGLSGCTIYSTTEPCPMCFSACHWAKVGRIVYGDGILDAQSAGFNELTISNRKMKWGGDSPVEIEGGVLRKECKELFEEWAKKRKCRTY
ncbi:MAG: nucleoside deaminase [Candidatus Altiarchaeota archaeon]